MKHIDAEPDKIYAGFNENTHLESYCLEKKGECQIEYLRKDIADEMVKSAEDHAYFAGQEKLREKLLEWAKEKQAHFRRRAGDISDVCNPDKFFFDGKEDAFKELIGKIESL